MKHIATIITLIALSIATVSLVWKVNSLKDALHSSTKETITLLNNTTDYFNTVESLMYSIESENPDWDIIENSPEYQEYIEMSTTISKSL